MTTNKDIYDPGNLLGLVMVVAGMSLGVAWMDSYWGVIPGFFIGCTIIALYQGLIYLIFQYPKEQDIKRQEELMKLEQKENRLSAEAFRVKLLSENTSKFKVEILPQIETICDELLAYREKFLVNNNKLLSILEKHYGVYSELKAKEEGLIILGAFSFDTLGANIQVEIGAAVTDAYNHNLNPYNEKIESLKELMGKAQELLNQKHLKPLLPKVVRTGNITAEREAHIQLPERYETDWGGKQKFRNDDQHQSAMLTAIKKEFSDRKMLPDHLVITLSRKAIEKHGYVIGGSGSGKSELLKLMVYEFIR